MPDILVVHGPNLNLLGTREPQHYGNATLADIDKHLNDAAKKAGVTISCVQSNAEHEIVNHIQAAAQNQTQFIIINPAAFTHTSVAIRDAITATGIPFIEVHLSNIFQREAFRHHSYFSDVAVGVISGLGAQGYELALQAAIAQLNQP
ncbi:MAG: type II 3-dehydroquinate dehydratase, partial [Gammaproteobacteria bacterium]